jgi:hypothetical protein
VLPQLLWHPLNSTEMKGHDQSGMNSRCHDIHTSSNDGPWLHDDSCLSGCSESTDFLHDNRAGQPMFC